MSIRIISWNYVINWSNISKIFSYFRHFFKKEYVHLASDLVAYESWVLNQRENATSSYKTKMLELEERENEKINEAYEMAQIDNMMFDLDRELKKTNDNE